MEHTLQDAKAKFSEMVNLTLAEFLLSAPRVELNIERSRDLGRAVSFE